MEHLRPGKLVAVGVKEALHFFRGGLRGAGYQLIPHAFDAQAALGKMPHLAIVECASAFLKAIRELAANRMNKRNAPENARPTGRYATLELAAQRAAWAQYLNSDDRSLKAAPGSLKTIACISTVLLAMRYFPTCCTAGVLYGTEGPGGSSGSDVVFSVIP